MSALPARAIGKYERLCWERHEKDLELYGRRGGHPRGLRFDPEAGERVIKFVEGFCKHHKGSQWAGKPLLLEEWQKQILRIAFGWMVQNKKGEWVRRYRTVYIEVARKNGKSELAGGLGLYLLVGDHEPGAEVYSSATKKEQAQIVWKTARAMVKASPKLQKFIRVFQNSLSVERTESHFVALGADSNTLDGLNPHGNIVDELHAHKDRGVWDVLDSAMGARSQPMTIAITTAGTYGPEAIGWQMHDYATKVLDGVFDDDQFFAYIAAPDDGDDPYGPVAHQKANPNYEVSVEAKFLEGQADKAKRMPGFTNEYLIKHVNIWTQQVTRWLPMDKWNACEEQLDDRGLNWQRAVARETTLERMPCWGGLDLSSKLDLTALCLEFPRPDGWADVIMRFWLPEARAQELAKKGHRFYENWAKDGWLTLTPGDVIDYEFIRAEINALAQRFVLKELAYDPWGATDLATRLQGDGIVMVECRQGFQTLSEPCKGLEALVVEKKLRHAANPVLRWCAANAVVARDAAGNIKPDKEKASDKIDGIVALAMALSRGIRAKGEIDHAYTSRGFLTL